MWILSNWFTFPEETRDVKTLRGLFKGQSLSKPERSVEQKLRSSTTAPSIKPHWKSPETRADFLAGVKQLIIPKTAKAVVRQ